MVNSALLASTQHRAGVLLRTLDELVLPREVGADSYRAAVRQLQTVARAIIEQAHHEASRAVDEHDAINRLRPLLQYLRETVDYVDLLFARAKADVPTSLVRSVQRELGDLGSDDVKPLLSVAGPGNYETDTKDLWSSLYDENLIPGLAQQAELIRVFTIPSLEGGRALWMPIAVGHEVAHLAVMKYGLLGHLDTHQWLDVSDIESAGIPPNEDMWPQSTTDILHKAREFLAQWTREVLCDLYAVRRFGPAGVAAQCDFLASIAAEQGTPPSTHPPAVFRCELMMGDDLAEGTVFEPVLAAWRSWADANRRDYDPAVTLILNAISDHRDEIVNALEQLPTRSYDISDRQEVVSDLVGWLRQGIAGRLHAGGKDVQSADILNAGWVARLTEGSLPGETAEALETLDDLVAKSLDTADFVRLWRANGDSPGSGESGPLTARALPEDLNAGDANRGSRTEAADGHRSEDVVGGVLTESELHRRLELGREAAPQEKETVRRRLVITPETSLRISGASLDIRLGRQFITFRRSSTASFSAVSKSQQPREMQELVEKDWGGEFVLHPGELVLAATLEYMQLPSDLTAQVITRSSYGRLGLLSATAVQVQPRFTGCLTLELVNLGQMPLTLVPGERVAQLVFTNASPPVDDIPAKYRFPTGPQFSRVAEDPDLAVLRRMHDARTV